MHRAQHPEVRAERKRPDFGGDPPLRRFDAILAFDALNVLGLTVRGAAGRRSSAAVGQAVTGLVGWVAALSARSRLARGGAGGASGSAAVQRLRLGLGVTVIGSAASIGVALRRPTRSASDVAAGVYLLVGGTVLSLAYLRVVRSARPPFMPET